MLLPLKNNKSPGWIFESAIVSPKSARPKLDLTRENPKFPNI